MNEVFRPTWAQINLDNIRQNFRNIRGLLQPTTKFCAVIKANGYGHGSLMLAKVYEKEGADYFAVATCEEAMELRQGGITTPILCLGYVPEDRYAEMIRSNIDITIYSMAKARLLSALAAKFKTKARIHIKLDTGMSRLGYQCEDKAIEEIKVIAKLEGITIQGLFTHFALADSSDKAYTHEQFGRYRSMVEKVERAGITIPIKHVCNSAGIMMFPEYHLDMVRAGIVLYGHYPSEEVDKSRLEIRPAMTLQTTVAHVKELEAGRGISYGHKYVTPVTEQIVTLPIGYADGFTRMLSGLADVKIAEEICPIVGRICMDQSMVKVTGNVQVGDRVTVFSDEQDLAIERFAEKLGTINYELLCMVQRRVPRVYTEGGKNISLTDYLLK